MSACIALHVSIALSEGSVESALYNVTTSIFRFRILLYLSAVVANQLLVRDHNSTNVWHWYCLTLFCFLAVEFHDIPENLSLALPDVQHFGD